jgi:hypothetical protein
LQDGRISQFGPRTPGVDIISPTEKIVDSGRRNAALTAQGAARDGTR